MIKFTAGPNLGTAALLLTAGAVVLNPVLPRLPDVTVPAIFPPGFTAPSFFSTVLDDIPVLSDLTVQTPEAPGPAPVPAGVPPAVAVPPPAADAGLTADTVIVGEGPAPAPLPTMTPPRPLADESAVSTAHPGIPLSPRQDPQPTPNRNIPTGVAAAGNQRSPLSVQPAEPSVRSGSAGRTPDPASPGPAHLGKPGSQPPPGPAGAMSPGGPPPPR